jgi:hypothetical protein
MPEGGVDEVEVELDVPSGDMNEVSVEGFPGAEMSAPPAPLGDEIVGEGVEKEGMAGCAYASKDSDYIKLSSVGKETSKKVTNYWKDILGYPEDYVKLMVKNYEK